MVADWDGGADPDHARRDVCADFRLRCIALSVCIHNVASFLVVSSVRLLSDQNGVAAEPERSDRKDHAVSGKSLFDCVIGLRGRIQWPSMMFGDAGGCSANNSASDSISTG